MICPNCGNDKNFHQKKIYHELFEVSNDVLLSNGKILDSDNSDTDIYRCNVCDTKVKKE